MPASFQKRAFPFRIDGVRAPGLRHMNVNIGRTIRLPGNKTLQLRVDALNVFNNETYDTPNLNPTSTQFGMVTANNGTYMRFVTFVTKLTLVVAGRCSKSSCYSYRPPPTTNQQLPMSRRSVTSTVRVRIAGSCVRTRFNCASRRTRQERPIVRPTLPILEVDELVMYDGIVVP